MDTEPKADATALDRLIVKWRADADAQERALQQYCYGGERDGDILDEDITLGFARLNQKRKCADELEAALAASRERPTPELKRCEMCGCRWSGVPELDGVEVCRDCWQKAQPQENRNVIGELQGLPERPIPNLFDAQRDAGRKRAVCVHGDKKHDCLCAVCPDCIIAALRKPDTRQPVVSPVPVEGLDEFFDLQDAPANDPRIAPKAIETICAMLGWMNVPPLRVLEAEIRAVKALRARLAAVEGAKK